MIYLNTVNLNRMHEVLPLPLPCIRIVQAMRHIASLIGGPVNVDAGTDHPLLRGLMHLKYADVIVAGVNGDLEGSRPAMQLLADLCDTELLVVGSDKTDSFACDLYRGQFGQKFLNMRPVVAADTLYLMPEAPISGAWLRASGGGFSLLPQQPFGFGPRNFSAALNAPPASLPIYQGSLA